MSLFVAFCGCALHTFSVARRHKSGLEAFPQFKAASNISYTAGQGSWRENVEMRRKLALAGYATRFGLS